MRKFKYQVLDADAPIVLQSGSFEISDAESIREFLERKFSADDVFWIHPINGVTRFGLMRYEKPIQHLCIWREE